MERYDLIYKVDKHRSHIRILGKEFFEVNKSFGHFIHKNRNI